MKCGADFGLSFGSRLRRFEASCGRAQEIDVARSRNPRAQVRERDDGDATCKEELSADAQTRGFDGLQEWVRFRPVERRVSLVKRPGRGLP